MCETKNSFATPRFFHSKNCNFDLCLDCGDRTADNAVEYDRRSIHSTNTYEESVAATRASNVTSITE